MYNWRRVNSKTSDTSTTPRSLSVNQAYTSSLVQHSLAASSNTTPYGLLYPPVAQSPTGDPSVSISSFYNQDRVGYYCYVATYLPKNTSLLTI
jgi:hypothetical protein